MVAFDLEMTWSLFFMFFHDTKPTKTPIVASDALRLDGLKVVDSGYTETNISHLQGLKRIISSSKHQFSGASCWFQGTATGE